MKSKFLLNNIFGHFSFFMEPVATEHQSHLLVSEVLLRIKVYKIVNYRKYIILIFTCCTDFCEFLETTFVLIESRLNQGTLVTTVILTPEFITSGHAS